MNDLDTIPSENVEKARRKYNSQSSQTDKSLSTINDGMCEEMELNTEATDMVLEDIRDNQEEPLEAKPTILEIPAVCPPLPSLLAVPGCPPPPPLLLVPGCPPPPVFGNQNVPQSKFTHD
jgi:hypothetical protein